MGHLDKMKDKAEKGWTEYDTHLSKAEDRLEATAHNADTSFREQTSGAETHLEEAEDRLEASARRVDAHAAELEAQVADRVAEALKHGSQKRK